MRPIGKFKDLTGCIFENVLVLNRAPNKRVNSRTTFVMWNCKCLLCGKEFISRGNNLTSGNTTSCGCSNKQKCSDAQLIDLTGKRFTRWLVEKRGKDIIRKNGYKRVTWTCLCDCGKRKDVPSDKLLNGESKSCGCYKRDVSSKRYTNDLSNQKFGHLTAIERVSKPGSTVYWKCVCDCGETVNVRAMSLKRGDTQSCGCKKFSINAEKIANILKENSVNYKKEYTFDDLKYKNLLRFDFALFENDNLCALIEYQGQQHYKETFNKDFGKQQREITDPMKREYCIKNNIKLYEIRYDDNVEEKLNSILKELNLKHANPVPSSN